MAISSLTDTVVWIVQWFLAAWFVGATLIAIPLLLTGRLTAVRVGGFSALSRRTALIIGLTHILGGLGLLVPQLSGTLPWLTPIAAAALAVQCFMASGFHLRANENAVEPALWGLLCTAVMVGRSELLTAIPQWPAGALAIGIGVLFLALVIGMVVVLRGPQNPLRQLAARQEADQQ